MTAPAINPQVVPMPSAHEITESHGPRTNPNGMAISVMAWAVKQNLENVSPVSVLAELLEALWVEPES